jgi:hypothetical protein
MSSEFVGSSAITEDATSKQSKTATSPAQEDVQVALITAKGFILNNTSFVE